MKKRYHSCRSVWTLWRAMSLCPYLGWDVCRWRGRWTFVVPAIVSSTSTNQTGYAFHLWLYEGLPFQWELLVPTLSGIYLTRDGRKFPERDTWRLKNAARSSHKKWIFLILWKFEKDLKTTYHVKIFGLWRVSENALKDCTICFLILNIVGFKMHINSSVFYYLVVWLTKTKKN